MNAHAFPKKETHVKNLFAFFLLFFVTESFSAEQDNEEILLNLPKRTKLTVLSDIIIPGNNQGFLIAQKDYLIECRYIERGELKCSHHGRLKKGLPLCKLTAHNHSEDIEVAFRKFTKGTELIFGSVMRRGSGNTSLVFGPQDNIHQGINIICGKHVATDSDIVGDPTIQDFDEIIKNIFEKSDY